MISAVGSIVLVLVYSPLSNEWILPVGFLLGYIDLMNGLPDGHIHDRVVPDQRARRGAGFCYNVGRGIGALFPALVGILADFWGLGNAIAIFGCAGLVMMILALMTCRKPGAGPGQRRADGSRLKHSVSEPFRPDDRSWTARAGERRAAGLGRSRLRRRRSRTTSSAPGSPACPRDRAASPSAILRIAWQWSSSRDPELPYAW